MELEQEKAEKAKRQIAEEQNEKAEKCLKSGELFLALSYNCDALSLDDKNASFYYTRARIYHKFWENEFHGKGYGDGTPHNAEIRARILRNCNLAIKYANSDKEKAEVYHFTARLRDAYWEKKGPYQDILEDIDLAVKFAESNEEKAKILNTLAEMRFAWDDPREALRVIEHAIKLDNSNIRLHINSAQANSTLARFRDDPKEKSARIQKAKDALYRALGLAEARNEENIVQWIRQELDKLDTLDK